jgi:hypothetical protein
MTSLGYTQLGHQANHAPPFVTSLASETNRETKLPNCPLRFENYQWQLRLAGSRDL